VCPTNFTFVEIKSRWNFSEFTRFLPQGLNPFKIHNRFKFEFVSEFITRILLIIWSWPNLESYSTYSNIYACKVWVFLEQGNTSILNLEVWASLNNLEIQFLTEVLGWPNSVVSTDHGLTHQPLTCAPVSEETRHLARHSVPAGPRRRRRFVWARSATSDLLCLLRL
jgi:hypothetical protein